METCIYHDGALGDALLSLPCLRAVGSDVGPVDWIGRPDVGELLHAAGLIAAVHDSGSSRFAQWHSPGPERTALDMLDRYDRLLLFTVQPRSDLERNVRSRVPNTTVIATVPPPGDRTHAAAFRLRQLQPELRTTVRSDLSMPADVRERAGSILVQAGHDNRKGLVVLHPGSGGRRKCWPLDRYFRLAEGLAESGQLFLLFLSGPVEEGETATRIERFVLGRTGTGIISGASLPSAAAVVGSSALYIGNDSGVTHLAAAAGAPVIALFGPSDPAVWAPVGDRVRVVAAPTIDEITVGAVLAAATAALGLRAAESIAHQNP